MSKNFFLEFSAQKIFSTRVFVPGIFSHQNFELRNFSCRILVLKFFIQFKFSPLFAPLMPKGWQRHWVNQKFYRENLNFLARNIFLGKFLELLRYAVAYPVAPPMVIQDEGYSRWVKIQRFGLKVPDAIAFGGNNILSWTGPAIVIFKCQSFLLTYEYTLSDALHI